MVAFSKLLVPDNATDALFRGWASKISESFDSFGLPKTQDSNQIDFSIVSKPNSFSTASSFQNYYEVRRLNDVCQSQLPIFFRLIYSGCSNDVTVPGIQLQIGLNGTNGQGVFTSTRTISIGLALAKASQERECFFSGDKNRFSIGFFINSQHAASYLSLERTKNAVGEDTAEGLMICCSGQQIAPSGYAFKGNLYLSNEPFVPNLQSFGFLFPSGGTTTSVDGNTVNVYPNYFFSLGGKVLNPGINQFGYFSGDLPRGSIIDSSPYGITRKYLAMGNYNHINEVTRESLPSACMMMLYT